ncbi:YozE family protein [Pradoshia sp.]
MKSFYQYLMTYRNALKKTEMSLFAENVFYDHGFPKNSSDYHEISDYLEMNGEYILDMSLFDEAWNSYLQHIGE